jgi:hypothetical protein
MSASRKSVAEKGGEGMTDILEGFEKLAKKWEVDHGGSIPAVESRLACSRAIRALLKTARAQLTQLLRDEFVAGRLSVGLKGKFRFAGPDGFGPEQEIADVEREWAEAEAARRNP